MIFKKNSKKRVGIDASRAFEKRKSGVGVYARELIGAMIDPRINDFNVKFYLFVKKGQKESSFINKLPKNWKVVELKFPPILWSQIALIRAVWKYKMDVIFIPSHALSLFYLPFRKKVGEKYVWKRTQKIYVLHGLEVILNKKFYPVFTGFIHGFLLKNSLRKADKIISVSETSTRKAIKKFGIDSKKISTLYQGVNVDKKSAGKKAVEKYNLIKKEYALFVGGWTARKNLLGLIEAFYYLKKKNKINDKFKLVLVGDKGYNKSFLNRLFDLFNPDYKYRVMQKIRRRGLQKDISIIGYCSKEERDALIKNARCLVMPSFDEGFARTVLESLFLKTPALVSNIDVFREIYEADKSFIKFVNPKSSKNIAKGIFEIYYTKPEVDLDYVFKLKQKFNWKKIAKQIIDIF